MGESFTISFPSSTRRQRNASVVQPALAVLVVAGSCSQGVVGHLSEVEALLVAEGVVLWVVPVVAEVLVVAAPI